MDSFEWNKIAGAVLGTLLFVVAVKIGSEMIFEVPMPLKPGYVVQGVPAPFSGGGAPAQPVKEPLPDFGTVLAKADVPKGQQVAGRCQQCHDFSKGGPDKIGPDLWGVIGRPRASRSGFSYSSAMSSSHAPWGFEALFKYLKSPQAVVPGTKMSFAGLPSAQDRIDLIAWLRTQSDSPVPIPPPAPAGASKTPAAPGNAAPAAPPGKAPAPAPAKPATPTKPG
jgi:cytochrome c